MSTDRQDSKPRVQNNYPYLFDIPQNMTHHFSAEGVQIIIWKVED